jgi:two-component system phosphate regulon sensor histidine kinase PhoR
MKLKPKMLTVVVAFIVTALVGLMVVQIALLNDALQLKEQAFRENVAGALGSAALRLATNETVAGVYRNAGPRSEERVRTRQTNSGSRHIANLAGRDSVFIIESTTRGVPIRLQERSFTYHIGRPQWVKVQVLGSQGLDSIIVDTVRGPGDYHISLNDHAGGYNAYFYRIETDSATALIHVESNGKPTLLRPPATERDRSVIVSRVLQNLWTSEKEPIERRVAPAVLDSVLRRSMRDAGIPLDFAFGVLNRKDSLVLAHPSQSAHLLRDSPYKAPLFIMEGTTTQHQLVVAFPGRRLFLLSQMWPLLAASMGFLAFVAGGFVVTINMLLRQRRTAGLMVDFVNTMTHEFKTPILTVALASEAIGRPDIESRKGKIRRYNRMIAEEANRMRMQVERILQMAELEEGDIELKMESVDVHTLLRTAAENLRLQVEARNGTIDLDLQAREHTITADPARLLEIVQNLLDNANKYSPGQPRISVTTRNDGRNITLSVRDQGIGIAPEHQKHVFDKYYRVPTGNLHDVKGFGIGLSYVRLLVEAHGGTIVLQSERGKGTEVIVTLPVRPPGVSDVNAG